MSPLLHGKGSVRAWSLMLIVGEAILIARAGSAGSGRSSNPVIDGLKAVLSVRDAMIEGPILIVDGLVERTIQFTVTELDKIPEPDRVPDASRYHPKRRGSGVTLEAILAEVRPLPEADYLTLHADRDDFHVSIPLDAVRAQGIVVYRLGENELGVDEGGPVRFLIKDPAACHTAELDDCANVKYLSRIELTEGKGRDNRPESDDAHEALHREELG